MAEPFIYFYGLGYPAFLGGRRLYEYLIVMGMTRLILTPLNEIVNTLTNTKCVFECESAVCSFTMEICMISDGCEKDCFQCFIPFQNLTCLLKKFKLLQWIEIGWNSNKSSLISTRFPHMYVFISFNRLCPMVFNVIKLISFRMDEMFSAAEGKNHFCCFSI